MKFIVEDIKKIRAKLGKKISDANNDYYNQKIEYPKINKLDLNKSSNNIMYVDDLVKKYNHYDDYRYNMYLTSKTLPILSPVLYTYDSHNDTEVDELVSLSEPSVIKLAAEEIKTILDKSEWIGPKDVEKIKKELEIILNLS